MSTAEALDTHPDTDELKPKRYEWVALPAPALAELGDEDDPYYEALIRTGRFACERVEVKETQDGQDLRAV